MQIIGLATVRAMCGLAVLVMSCSGDKGLVGPAGPQGDAGAQGPRGATGPTGPQGPSGPPGPAGARGFEGPLVSRDQLPCPEGMINLGATCMDRDFFQLLPEGSSFGLALNQCKIRHARLCSYGEWAMACREFAGQLLHMPRYWERVDSVQFVDGGAQSLVAGSGNCEAIGVMPLGDVVRFRCCL